jgi:Gas vesicle synthesis protein GvpL/GvpF
VALEAGAATGVYVYGVVRTGSLEPLALEGVQGRPVELVAEDDLTAVATRLSSPELRARKRDLVNHLAVLEQVFATATLVPCAFGTVFPDEQAVRGDLLTERRDELNAVLAQLRDKVQINVKAVYDETVILSEIVATDREISRLNELTRSSEGAHAEKLRLGELVAARISARREADAVALVEGLRRFAVDELAEAAQAPIVVKAAYLVDRADLERFDGELERIAAEVAPRMSLEAIGPLPPTAFVSLAGRWDS